MGAESQSRGRASGNHRILPETLIGPLAHARGYRRLVADGSWLATPSVSAGTSADTRTNPPPGTRGTAAGCCGRLSCCARGATGALGRAVRHLAAVHLVQHPA